MTIRLTTTVSDRTIQQIKELKERFGGTKSEMVRRAVLELWEREVETRRNGEK